VLDAEDDRVALFKRPVGHVPEAVDGPLARADDEEDLLGPFEAEDVFDVRQGFVLFAPGATASQKVSKARSPSRTTSSISPNSSSLLMLRTASNRSVASAVSTPGGRAARRDWWNAADIVVGLTRPRRFTPQSVSSFPMTAESSWP